MREDGVAVGRAHLPVQLRGHGKVRGGGRAPPPTHRRRGGVSHRQVRRPLSSLNWPSGRNAFDRIADVLICFTKEKFNSLGWAAVVLLVCQWAFPPCVWSQKGLAAPLLKKGNRKDLLPGQFETARAEAADGDMHDTHWTV